MALSLGSNTSDPELQLRRALAGLRPYLTEARPGPLFRTRPVSPLPQPDYLNTAVVARCALRPEELLAVGKALEWAAGRRRGPRDGPRPLDVDLLLWGKLESSAPELCLPHPELARRRFYLAPLAELAGGLRVPPRGHTVAELLARLDEGGGVRRVAWSDPAPAAW